MLVGRTITKAEYLSADEAKSLDWFYRSLVITLDDGTVLIPMSDDEGNNAGAIMTTNEGCPVIPVI